MRFILIWIYKLWRTMLTRANNFFANCSINFNLCLKFYIKIKFLRQAFPSISFKKMTILNLSWLKYFFIYNQIYCKKIFVMIVGCSFLWIELIFFNTKKKKLYDLVSFCFLLFLPVMYWAKYSCWCFRTIRYIL